MPAAIPAVVAIAAGAAASYAAGAAILAVGGAALVTAATATAAASLTFGGMLVAGAIGSVVAMGASMLVSSAMGLNKRPGTPTPAAQDRKQMLRQPVAPRQIIYGRARVGGTLVYAGSSGDDRRFLHLVAVLAGHRCDAVETVFVGDVEIPMTDRDASGVVTAGPLAGLCRIRAYLGTQTAADADLVAESPDGWAASDVGFGVTYLYIRLTYDREKFAAGLQNISAVVRGKNDIADPRSGAVGYTTNWAACLLDYLRSPMGVAATADEIHMPSFVAAANLSDEAVPLNAEGTQTQPRYTCDIVLSRDGDRRQIVAAMLSAGAGVLTYSQGQYRLHGGAFTAPTASLGVSDLAGDVQLTLRAPRRESFNALKGTFIDPSKAWQESPFPAVTIPALEAEEGERVWRDIELPAVIDAIRAQRLARIELLRGREQERVEVPLRYAGIRFVIWQMLSVTLPDLGWVAKPMRVEGWRFSPDGGSVVVQLREESAAAYAWVHDAAAQVPLAPDTTLISPLNIPAPTALSVTPATSLQADGAVVPALAVTWTPAAHAFVTGHEVQWRVAAGPGPWSAAEVPGGTARYLIAPVVVGQALDVRVRAIAALARSGWTSSVQQAGAPDTTPPAAPGNLAATGLIRGYSVSWTLPADLDLAVVEVWEATGGPDPAGRAFVAETRATGFVRTGLAPAAMRWVWVRARDRSGNTSAFVGPVQVTASMAIASDIQDGIVNTAKFAAGIEPVGLVTGVPTTKSTEVVFNRSDGKLYRWNGSAYTAAVPATDINGEITTTQIGPNSVTSNKIAANAITAGKIAAGAITSTEIAAGAIRATNLASETLITQAAQLGTAVVGTAQLGTAVVGSAQIGTAAITTVKIGEAQIDTLRVAGNAITTHVSSVWEGWYGSPNWAWMTSGSNEGGFQTVVMMMEGVPGQATTAGGGEEDGVIFPLRFEYRLIRYWTGGEAVVRQGIINPHQTVMFGEGWGAPVTYAFQVRSEVAGFSVQAFSHVSRAHLVVLLTKR